LIYTLSESFSRLPTGSALIIEKPLIDSVVRLFGSVFVISFKIAAPVTAAILVVDVALGVISKAVPQVNVFIVGLPIKILIGLLVILLTLAAFRNIVHVITAGMQSEMTNFIDLIKGE
jgi:flagellar biosynthetic protein FliR